MVVFKVTSEYGMRYELRAHPEAAQGGWSIAVIDADAEMEVGATFFPSKESVMRAWVDAVALVQKLEGVAV